MLGHLPTNVAPELGEDRSGATNMTVKEISIPLTLPPPKVARSKGVHLSAIIRCIAIEMGILKPEWIEESSLADSRTITDPTAVLRILIGLAWDQLYIPEILSHEGVLDHPDEMCLDDVYMSPDGESISVIITPTTAVGDRTRHIVIHEVKATYKSTKTVGDLTSQWMWLAQIKGYCKGAKTTFAVLHVLFLCGDYSYPITPVNKVWELEFTQKEIDENWDLMRDYRDEKLKGV